MVEMAGQALVKSGEHTKQRLRWRQVKNDKCDERSPVAEFGQLDSQEKERKGREMAYKIEYRATAQKRRSIGGVCEPSVNGWTLNLGEGTWKIESALGADD